MGAIPGVSAVVLDAEGRLLLVRRARPPWAGRWSLPGGRVEPGESAEQAVTREVAEETGLAVAAGRFLGSTRPRAPSGGRYEVRVYACALVSPGAGAAPRAADDATAAGWFTLGQAQHLPLVPGLLRRLDRWGALEESAPRTTAASRGGAQMPDHPSSNPSSNPDPNPDPGPEPEPEPEPDHDLAELLGRHADSHPPDRARFLARVEQEQQAPVLGTRFSPLLIAASVALIVLGAGFTIDALVSDRPSSTTTTATSTGDPRTPAGPAAIVGHLSGLPTRLGLGETGHRDWLVIGARNDGKVVRMKRGTGTLSAELPADEAGADNTEAPLTVNWQDGAPEQDRTGNLTWWTAPAAPTVFTVRLSDVDRLGSITLYTGGEGTAVEVRARVADAPALGPNGATATVTVPAGQLGGVVRFELTQAALEGQVTIEIGAPTAGGRVGLAAVTLS